MVPSNGRYVCLEGIDGSGKTRIASLLSTMIRDRTSYDVVTTREPGSPHLEVCMGIREIVLNKNIKKDATFTHLFMADNYEHLSCFVEPCLKEGKIIISDRCLVSDYAYRPGKSLDIIRKVNLDYFLKLNPKIFLLTVDVGTAIQRINKGRGGVMDYFEERNVLGSMEKINDEYLNVLENLEKNFGIKRFVMDNNSANPMETVNKIFNYLFDTDEE